MIEISVDNKIKKHVEEIITILKESGCKEVYLFGSILGDGFNDNSDIDFAVRGLSPEKFISTYARILMAIDIKVDLVDLDEEDDYFVKNILQKQEMLRVA